MTTTRREFLARSAAAGAAALAGACASRGAGSAADPLFKLSLAQWSLHRALEQKTIDPLDFPTIARRDYALSGCEYVSIFYQGKARDEQYLADLKGRASDAGVRSVLIMVDNEGSLADAASRAAAIENHHQWIEAAGFLGCHSIRVNARGKGSPEEQQKLMADSLVQLANYGERYGVCVIVENHGGLSSDGTWMAGVMRLANNPRVGTLPDFGNFHVAEGIDYDRYQGIRDMMPFAKGVSAKSYGFDAQGDETTIDYPLAMAIVVENGYHGFVGIEYEGDKASEDAGIRSTKALLERIRASMSRG